jgi:hypothetical protein
MLISDKEFQNLFLLVKKQKTNEIIPKNSSEFLKPAILFGTLKDLSHMNRDLAEFITAKLNGYLQSQITNTIGSVSELMARTLQKIVTNIDYQEVKDSDLVVVIKEEIIDEIRRSNNDQLIKEAEELGHRLQNISSPKIDDLLQLDVPLRENPIFDSDIRTVKIIEYAKVANLDEETARKLVDKNILYFDDTDETILSNLVKEIVINEEQKQNLMLVGSLSKLTGDNLPFIKALKSQELKSTANFVTWEKADWLKLIKDERIPLPPNETIETYSENVLYNIKRTYPSQFFVNRFTEKDDGRHKIDLLDSLNTLLENHNDRLINGNHPANIDWRGIGAETRERMQKDLEQLTVFANSYRHLGLVDLINNKQLSLAAKKQAINSRFQLINKFFNNNPDLDLRYANFFDTKDSDVNWEGISPTDKPIVRKQVMACQRTLDIAKDPEDSMILLSKGYDSVMAISEKSESEFIQSSGLDLGKARLTYAKAQRYSEVVAHNFETIRDALKGQFKDIRMANISTRQLANELQEINGFSDLFGSQNFCGCEECTSILSPAAYFVDLMRFIDTNVSQQVFSPPNDHHPLKLAERRKDLWELELTCDNTHTLIPYLTIVNEVLERYVESIVIQQPDEGDVYEKFSENSLLTKVSFSLPLNLPLEELRIYLNHFSTSLHGIYHLLKLIDEKVWRARIGLSKEEFAVITTPEDPIENIKWRFGNRASFTDFPLQDFIRFAGINREQLDQLLSIKFNSDLKNIDIGRKEQDPAADEILQNFEEILNQLTFERLDFIHRFIRLWKKTPWSISELDLVLASLSEAMPNVIFSDLNAAAVTFVAQLIDIQEKLKLNVEELCALFHFLPVSQNYPEPPANDGDKMLFERIFDPKKLFGVDPNTGSVNSSTPPDNPYHHYSLNKDDPNDQTIDSRTPLLLAGLSISETELLLLFDLLKDEIPFNHHGDCKLDKNGISLLYRHTRLAKALKLTIEDFIVALKLNFAMSGNNAIVVRDLQQVFKLIEFKEWIKNTQFKVSELNYILLGRESRIVKSKMTLDNVANLVLEIQRSNDPAIEIEIDDLMTSLLTLFNLSPVQLGDILNKWVPTDINNNITANSIKTALNTSFTQEGVPINSLELVPLVNLLEEIERTLLLFSNLKFREETVHFITTKKQLVGIVDLKQLTLDDIILLVAYNKHTTIENDDETESLVQSVLNNYSKNNAFLPEDIDTLASLWKKDTSLINSLVKSLAFPTKPMEAVEYLWKCLEVSDILGINGFSLAKLGQDNNYDDLLSARDIVLGAFSSKYDEKTRNEKLEPYNDSINVMKRDILCNYIIARQADLEFKDLNDIYSYLLLDVEMGSCFRISRLVCAISSLQLYVHRCLVNLERSATQGDPNVDPSRIPADEWEWRNNYRVWEANRKVFLYPENYLEPDLRDDKTPIFNELEEELLQEKITKESAEAAYRKYVSQLAELAHLKISGSYCHNDGATWTYYFFARTQQDPPQYYYRKWNYNNVWTPWQKIEQSVDSDQVSAIIHLGKLYLFWVSIVSTSRTEASNITNVVTTYKFSKQLVYTFLNEQGKWIPPQKLPWASTETPFSNAPLPRKIIFPLKGDRIYLTTYDSINFPFLNKISTLNLFRNELVDYDGYLAELISSKSNLLAFERQESTSEFTHVQLKTYRNSQRLHESEFEDRLYTPLYPGTADNVGIYVTNSIVYKDFFPELHLVGYRPGDFVFKFGGQEYLIQRQYGTHIDPDDIGPLNPGNFLNMSAITGNPNTSSKVNNSPSAMLSLFTLPGDPVSKRYMFRLSTSLVDDLGDILFTNGLEEFLSLTTQMKKEYPLGLDFVEPTELLGPYDNVDHIDFKGAYGTYYRELFFHIPFLIANHLNSSQKFEEAKWWYERIFNPTASEPSTVPSTSERVWRYIEFRNITIQKMKDILTDEAAIETYQKDPFNPHAIARLRLNAYQKAIVMKYIDNLIDWGDYLFAQDTMESINEATMLYVLASDILGKRPIEIGTCEIAMGTKGEGGAGDIECKAPLTYEKIEACSIDTGTDFLIELENWQYSNMIKSTINAHKMALDRNTLADISVNGSSTNSSSVGGSTLSNVPAILKPRYEIIYYADLQKLRKHNDQIISEWEDNSNVIIKKLPASSMIVKPSMLAFCIPPNNGLLAYWDRVEDRLFKIRNCMNISGIRRQLALFQPPISPMALVRAKAAGLTLEEIVMPQVELPPYRFIYLIEKAKQFTQTLQNFGSALLSALEKKDVEELTLLRSVHERNILTMTKEVKDKQIEESNYQLSAALAAKENVQNRIDYYTELISGGLTGWEQTEQYSKRVAGTLRGAAGLVHLVAAVAGLLPNVGSPFAMTYGGVQLGANVRGWAAWAATMAEVANDISSAAGLEATFQRREEEWKEQKKLAEKELEQSERQRLVADIRVKISEKDSDIHDTNIQQANELDEFYKNKFTKLGLYDYLSTSLNRLYREAYTLAYNMAKMTERSYEFETNDDTIFIANDNWQLDNAGLLAGERLLLQLQRMETAYLENNKRENEVTQSFSLSLLDPEKLISLRQTGSCEFAIPEIMFDLLYPGQYKRLIKSVRLTIPCVAGPYTNISSKLTLIDSWIRKEPTNSTNPVIDPADLISVPEQRLASIATSNAQSDTGTFEFSFRDERYMPFEGAGAISSWRLELPSKIRSFDYDTISDAIMHISYTAKEDGVYRTTVENQIVDILSEFAAETGLFRLISLKHEFPNNYHQLLNPPTGQPQSTEFNLERKHFPYFISDKELMLSSIKVYLKPKGKETEINVSGLTTKVKVNNASVSANAWHNFDENGEKMQVSDELSSITETPINKWTIDVLSGVLNKEVLDDILVLLKYTAS